MAELDVNDRIEAEGWFRLAGIESSRIYEIEDIEADKFGELYVLEAIEEVSTTLRHLTEDIDALLYEKGMEKPYFRVVSD